MLILFKNIICTTFKEMHSIAMFEIKYEILSNETVLKFGSISGKDSLLPFLET
jgi:hypothetical protein